jgi:hypothetical protein
LGYNKIMPDIHCEHVYKNMGKDLCPKCGGYTHEANWKQQYKLHKEWIDSGKTTVQGWFSI